MVTGSCVLWFAVFALAGGYRKLRFVVCGFFARGWLPEPALRGLRFFRSRVVTGSCVLWFAVFALAGGYRKLRFVVCGFRARGWLPEPALRGSPSYPRDGSEPVVSSPPSARRHTASGNHPRALRELPASRPRGFAASFPEPAFCGLRFSRSRVVPGTCAPRLSQLPSGRLGACSLLAALGASPHSFREPPASFA